VRLQPKPSYARSAQMCPGFAMVRTLSREQDQWWQGALYEESPRQERRCHGATHGRELPASR
jgi:hypothetical protein